MWVTDADDVGDVEEKCYVNMSGVRQQLPQAVQNTE